jgi:lysyl-tRNA synthetase, class I
MFWADKIAAEAQGAQIVNDSKTPSGRVHVGSLRGVVIHDVIYRALKQAGKPVKFMYGVDDYDALDTVPHYLDQEKFSPYLGEPLCNVPSPGEGATDYAKFFMNEFLEVFDYLGVKPEIYYLRDLYRTGKLNEHIDRFLQNAHLVREAYLQVSKAQRADNWYPFQVICEKCRKIATTTVTEYNGKEVFYTCQPNATDWVRGCGHSGWISPFDGNGKLPWKVEWVAKWEVVGVTIEMAGKDHSQKGGSRDVANAICRKVFQKQPPFHSPYEFILLQDPNRGKGAKTDSTETEEEKVSLKMSSSRGVGASAQGISELLPPELLRFLMLRTQPRSVINFSPNLDTVSRLFRDYDTLNNKYREKPELEEDLMPLLYSQMTDEIKTFQPFDFSTLVSLLQIPHLDINQEIVSRSPANFSDFDQQIANQRVKSAQKWLDDYANPEEKLTLYVDSVPETVHQLTPQQLQYLEKLIGALEAVTSWDGETLQNTLFAVSKDESLEITQPIAFQAIYRCFMGKDKGPKAGALLSYLDRSMVIQRLKDAIAPNS